MRVLLWNCNNGINKQSQISYFQSFKPDLAIIPELKEANIRTLAPSSNIWITNNHSNSKPKGLGVLAFNGLTVRQLQTNEDMEIFIPVEVQKGDFSFKLLAVWNFYSACKQGRFKGVKGEGALEYVALNHYMPTMGSPSLIVGDRILGQLLLKGVEDTIWSNNMITAAFTINFTNCLKGNGTPLSRLLGIPTII